MRVLFIWELGSGLGHIAREVPIALELRRRGHEVLFVVRNLAAARAALGQHGIDFLQAPLPLLTRRVAQSPRQFRSYADILAAAGFAEPRALTDWIAGWKHTLALLRPQVVVCDYSPAAQLAAQLGGYPVVQVGTGFELPPVARLLPDTSPSGATPMAHLEQREQRVLHGIAAACVAAGHAPIQRVAQIYATDAPLLATLPEVDCFGPRTSGGARYVGPLYAQTLGRAMDWPGGGGRRRVFAYLRGEYMRGRTALEAALSSLQRSGAAVIACVPDADEELVARYSGAAMQVSVQPVTLAPLLQDADLVISNAGAGLLAQALLAGVPLLLLPWFLEQKLNALAVTRSGAAAWISSRKIAQQFDDMLARMLESEQYRQAARRIAHRHRGLTPERTALDIAAIIESLGRGQRRQDT